MPKIYITKLPVGMQKILLEKQLKENKNLVTETMGSNSDEKKDDIVHKDESVISKDIKLTIICCPSLQQVGIMTIIW